MSLRKALSLCFAGMLLFSAAGLGEEEDDLLIEEIVEHVLLDDENVEVPYVQEASSGREIVYTPSYGSSYDPLPGENNFWTFPMDITDEAAVWEMLMTPITVVDIGKKSTEKTQTYLYREPDENSLKVGVVTCESQGVRVLETLDNGWSLVECYSSSFHATKVEAWNLLVSGYIPTSYLKEVSPNQHLAMICDKLTQRVYIFQDGKLFSTLMCSTGLVQWNGTKFQPYNETRSGEFLLMSRVGTLISDRLFCDMAIRFNDGDMIHEVPHVKNSDGVKNYSSTEYKLGTRGSHGCIRIQRNKTPEGTNMGWIWNQLKSGSKVKFVIWEDWQGRQVSYPDPSLQLYYNPKGGQYYHSSSFCYSASGVTFQPFSYIQLEEEPFSKLKFCPYCVPALRQGEIDEINAAHALGGDHDPLLTSLREGYYEYRKQN